MPAYTVGTSAVQVNPEAVAIPVIQNLGPGIVYIGRTSGVTTSNGMQIPVGAVYEWPVAIGAGGSSPDVYAIADTAGTNVRVLSAG